MRRVPNWNAYYIAMAYATAARSKDPSTQVGCVLVNQGTVVATGFNGFPEGAHEEPWMWERPEKYKRVIHAEMNAIARAARSSSNVLGSTAYVTLVPCENCTKALIAAGITRIVYDQFAFTQYLKEHGAERHHASTFELLEWADVLIEGA
jgi:dCMP deaminase